MSRERESGTTVVNQTTTPEASAEEQRLNQLEIERQERLFEPTIGLQETGIESVRRLLAGEPLTGVQERLSGGISPEITADISRQAIEDIQPNFQNLGIGDSGVAAELSARTAADVRRASEEFNIGNLFNLLNLGVGGQAQVQQPVLGFSSQLSQRLAGLRPTTTQGTQQSRTSRFGFDLGSPSFSSGPFGFGG